MANILKRISTGNVVEQFELHHEFYKQIYVRLWFAWTGIQKGIFLTVEVYSNPQKDLA